MVIRAHPRHRPLPGQTDVYGLLPPVSNRFQAVLNNTNPKRKRGLISVFLMARKLDISWSASTSAKAETKDHRPDLNDPPLLDVRHLHVTFGRQNVLRDINLRIPRGQTVAIIGESGCGKTVLLKTLIALIEPTRGEVLFDGHKLAELQGRELVEQRIRF